MFRQTGIEPVTHGLIDRSSCLLSYWLVSRPLDLMPVVRLRVRRDGEVTRALPIVLHVHAEDVGGLEPPSRDLVPHPVDPAYVDVIQFVARHSVVNSDGFASTGWAIPTLGGPRPLR